jgi:zinc protease
MEKSESKRLFVKVLVVGFSLLIVPLILLMLALILPANAITPKHYTELTFPPLAPIQIPKYQRFRLANGITVYLMEDHELPLVGGTALIRTGDRLEPENQVGLASIMATVMRTGGTAKYPGEQLNRVLEQRAASVETGMDEASASAGFSALSEDLDTVFDLFAEVVQKPAFPEEKLSLAKNQQRGAIARRNDNPGSIASREFEKLIYGNASPYARTVEYTTLDNITRPDLLRFYQQYYKPQNMLLGIVGDFDSQKMRRLVEAKFANWNPAGTRSASGTPALPAVTQANRSGVFLVNQPQLTQSNVQIGHLGGQLNSPDYAALAVMNGVLNGFGGRLFNQVRSRQGLAYSVYAAWRPSFDYPGVFMAGGQTRSDATVPFIQSIRAEIEKIRTQPITPEELAYAKDTVLNSFIFNFQDPAQTLARLLRYDYFGYPADFIFRYRKGVETTAIADVQRVAKTYLQPQNLVTLVVGNATQIQPPLTALGANILGAKMQVTNLDVTIPAPKAGK